uniref:Uncharacterized protein n=1 Tax=Arundo donax TaxID=35708 RepID=A0A0A9HKV9_ARUDO
MLRYVRLAGAAAMNLAGSAPDMWFQDTSSTATSLHVASSGSRPANWLPERLR